MIALALILALAFFWIDTFFLSVFLPVFTLSFSFISFLILLIFNKKREAEIFILLNATCFSLVLSEIQFGYILVWQIVLTMLIIALLGLLQPINTKGAALIFLSISLLVYGLSLNFFRILPGTSLNFLLILKSVLINLSVAIIAWHLVAKLIYLSRRFFILNDQF